MASAGWLPQQRPDIVRPGRIRIEEEENVLDRLLAALRPDEGFIGLGLVLLLTGIMGWSIADSRWILGRDELTSFLIWLALGGAMWGYVTSRLDMSPWVAQTLGCVVGAFAIIELVGMRMPNATAGPIGWAQATAYSVTQAYFDLTWRHQVSTLQYGHFCLVLGILVWGTAQAASYDIFGYRRAVNGVLLLAVVFVANMALTIQDQFQALVIFCSAALVLLLLSHAADERISWLRHRIWRGRDFQAPHMQGGMAFAGIAVVGAMVLTTVASSAPLASTVSQFDLQNSLSFLNQYLPNGGQSRYQGTAQFSTTTRIDSAFHASSFEQFTVHVSTGLLSFHWRVISYDTFQTTGWTVGQTTNTQVIAGTSLDGKTLDQVGSTTPGRSQVEFTVHVQDPTIKYLIVANEPDSVNVPVTQTVVGEAGTSDTVGWPTDATDYVVSAFVPNLDPTGGGLTEWRLQHAGNDFPAGLLTRYTQGTGQVGAQGRALLEEIRQWAISQGNAFNDEYDVAKAMQSYLQSNRFTYNADISQLMPRCTGMSTVDCFALLRTGFCQQYATTMTMLMRLAGYPARYVQGYLPGAVAENTHIEQVTSQQKHSWVEVYFPTYGWIPFDPTGGNVGQPTELPVGSAVEATPLPSVRPSSSIEPAAPTPNSGGAGAVNPSSDNTAFTLALITGIIVLLVVLGLFAFWRRRPSRLESPETVYRRVVALASRLGYRPKPTQTVYEYAGMLADVVPSARDSLGVVAMATVEVQYGKRQIGVERLTALGEAHRIIRSALLKLVLRMPSIPGRSRRRR
jgi:transglutaminase-like putative cysteine protease